MRVPGLILACLVSTQASAEELTCTFTQICTPLTGCQDHSGVPLRFDVTDERVALLTDTAALEGTQLAHIEPPAFSALFEVAPESTILLTISGTGEAVLTQQDITISGAIRSVSYFGTCEPGA